MITEIAICYDYFPTDTLETILRKDLQQGNTPFLSTDAILHISELLCNRRPFVDPEYETRKKKFYKQMHDKFFDIEEDTEA